MVDHLQKKFEGVDDVALACVYFNYKEATTPKDIIGNLLKQLWQRTSDLSNEAQTLYSSHQKWQTQPNIKELLPLLRAESGRVSTFFIVLDALDEFDDTHNARATILLELRQIPNVRVMITGRTHMERTVSKLDEVATLSIRASNSDIRRYLDARIEKTGYLGDEVKSDQDLRATVIDGIIRKADGMYNLLLWRPKSDNFRFLVAALQLQCLEEQPNKHRILSALSQLPRGLDQTYEAAVSRITAQPNPENIELALKALKWLAFAREHLQEKALLHALAVKDDNTDIKESHLPNLQMVLSLCGGLVVLDQESRKIRLVHETTQQFFQQYFRDVRHEDGDAEIANVCLRYFSMPAFSRSFKDKDSIRDHMERYNLSQYAATYWFVHLREEGLEEKFVPSILKTFESPGVRNSIVQIFNYAKGQLLYSLPLRFHLLHLASMHGLCILCREILQSTNKMQRLYRLIR